jgi:L-alanine-DL-glutamate epimerase-like enolase superfamily enzyme
MTEPINRVTAAAYRIPTDAPEADGTFSWSSTTVVMTHVSAAGVTGMGWTYGAAECAALIESTLAECVVGNDPMDVPRSWTAMIRRVRNLGRQGVAGYAISAVDTALWDLKARLLEQPLGHLFGTAAEHVPVYGSGGFTTYDDAEMAEQLRGWVDDQGIGRVKIKIGQDWGSAEARDLARIEGARAAVGPAAELFVDANGGYNRKQACRVADRMARFGVSWYEEPVSSDDLDGLRLVRDHSGADVAAGEYGFDLFCFRRLCESGAVDCLQIDATRCGGYTEWLRAAAVAASYGLQVSAHCAPNLHAHVAAATPNLRHLEWFHDHVRIESDLFDGSLSPSDGALALSDRSGNGMTFRSATADRYRVG